LPIDNKWRIIIKSERGASSVLVVLVLVVLLGLGLAALTTSLASVRLGEKSGEWYSSYYELDRKAEEKLALIDRIIHISYEQTTTYMEEEKYLSEEGDLDEKLQEKIYEEWRENNGSDQAKYRITRMVYLFYLNRELKEKDPGFFELDITHDNMIQISFIEKGASDSGFRLKVTLRLPESAVDYEIIEWKQYNER
jgi:hypothetical protein